MMVLEPDDWICGKERCGYSPSLMLRYMSLAGVYAAFEPPKEYSLMVGAR